MRIFLLGFLSILIAGCVTQQERQEQRFAALQSQCQSYGFEAGTQEFANCMMQIDQADRQRRAAIIMNQPKPQTTNTNCYMIGGSLNCTSSTR